LLVHAGTQHREFMSEQRLIDPLEPFDRSLDWGTLQDKKQLSVWYERTALINALC
jgi:hypothetical protein